MNAGAQYLGIEKRGEIQEDGQSIESANEKERRGNGRAGFIRNL